MSEKRTITAEDLYQFQIITSAQIAPNGEKAAFVAQRVDEKTEKKYSNIWLAEIAGIQSTSHQFTHGNQRDSQPRWSPDGKTLAFVSNRDDEKQAQIYLIPVAGGEAKKLTDLQGSIRSFEWSPDGKTLLLNFRQKDEEAIEREKEPQKKELGVVARRITRVFYNFDGEGYFPQEKWHIWTVDVATGEATQLTDGDKDELTPTWSPDGSTILFASNRHDDPDFNLDAVELYAMPAEGGDITQLQTGHDKQKFTPRYSPDGKWIAYIGRRHSGKFYQNSCLYLVPASGGTAVNLTAEHDLHLNSMTINDIGGYPPIFAPTWSHDSQTIYVQVTQQGNQPIYAISLDGNAEPAFDDKGVYGAFSLDNAGNCAAYFYATMQDPGQIYASKMGESDCQQLTHLNQWLDEVDLGEVEEVKLERDDAPSLHAWLFKPPGFSAGNRYPSILNIHGGPQTQYGNFFMHEMFYWSAQGYLVYGCNPRGSQGYGEEYAGAIDNQWGTVDYDDVMAIADHIEALPYSDPHRMGVTGGSYGGWMTATIIGRTHRFKGAVAQRAPSNWVSMYGSSDLSWLAGTLFGSGAPWERMEDYIRQSPIYNLHHAKTPTMIMHSENDLRCSQEQGEQLFVSLKVLGIDTELILFPGESHGLSRGGRTDRRIVRLNHILRWMDKYVQGG